VAPDMRICLTLTTQGARTCHHSGAITTTTCAEITSAGRRPVVFSAEPFRPCLSCATVSVTVVALRRGWHFIYEGLVTVRELHTHPRGQI
jgi:hypothetical protein